MAFIESTDPLPEGGSDRVKVTETRGLPSSGMLHVSTFTGAVYELDLDSMRIRRTPPTATETDAELVMKSGEMWVAKGPLRDDMEWLDLHMIVRLELWQPAVFKIKKVHDGRDVASTLITSEVVAIEHRP